MLVSVRWTLGSSFFNLKVAFSYLMLFAMSLVHLIMINIIEFLIDRYIHLYNEF